MYIVFGLSLILTFSYKFVELIIRIFWSKNMVRYSVLFWAGVILVVALFLIKVTRSLESLTAITNIPKDLER